MTGRLRGRRAGEKEHMTGIEAGEERERDPGNGNVSPLHHLRRVLLPANLYNAITHFLVNIYPFAFRFHLKFPFN